MSREKQDYDALREKVLEMLSCKAVRAFIQKKLNITDEEWVKELRPFLLVKGVDVRFQERDVPIILPEIERLISEKKPTRKIKKLLVISDGFWRNRIKDLLSEAVVNNMKENTQICRAKSLGSKDYSGIVKESIGLLKSGYTQTSAAKKMKVSTSILRYHMRKQLSEKEYEEIVCRKGKQMKRSKNRGRAADPVKLMQTIPDVLPGIEPHFDNVEVHPISKKELAMNVKGYNARYEEEKSDRNLEFLRTLQLKNVFDVNAGERSWYELHLPEKQVCSNDFVRKYNTKHHEDHLKLMKRFAYEGKEYEAVDLDPYNNDALPLLPFAALIATKGIAVTLCCGATMRFATPRDRRLYNIPEGESFSHNLVVKRVMSALELMGLCVEEMFRVTLSDNGVRVYIRIISKPNFNKGDDE